MFNRSIWGLNLISTFLSCLVGFGTPFLIAIFYDIDVFGVFNQIYAWYIVFSQLGAFGIHLSMMKHLAEYDQNHEKIQIIFTSGVWLSFLSGLLFASTLWILSSPIGRFLCSPTVGFGLRAAAAGIFFFAINKCLLFSLNGLSLFHEYALFQMLRYLLMLFTLVFLVLFQISGKYVSFIFPVAEGFLFLGLILYFRARFIFEKTIFSEINMWVKLHLNFGIKASLGHILLDLNTRIDVLFLGFFVDDKTVGFYSMAAIIAEAALQLPVVFRTIYTPTVVKYLSSGKLQELSALVKKSRTLLWHVMLIITAAGFFFVKLGLPSLTGKSEYGLIAPLYLILMIGVIIASGYTPFSLILANGGYPGIQSLITLFVVLTNAFGNVLLIPFWGNYGAAIATTTANIVSVFLLKYFTRKFLQAFI